MKRIHNTYIIILQKTHKIKLIWKTILCVLLFMAISAYFGNLVFMHIICILFHLSHLHSINGLLSIDKIRYDKDGYCVLDDTTSEHFVSNKNRS